MPSCDGSGSACSSNCSACRTRTEYVDVHLEEKERKKFEKRISELQAELKNERKLNSQLVERLLDEKRL